MERRVATMDGIAAVLGEQRRQKSLGQMDDESIRCRYMIATKDLVTNAIVRGAKDAEEAQDGWDDGKDACKTSGCDSSPALICDSTITTNQLKRGSSRIFCTKKTLQHILSRATKAKKWQEPAK